MDAHTDPDLLCSRDHLTQEAGQVVAQSLAGHAMVALQHPSQAGDVVAVERARQAGHDVGEKSPAVLLGRALEPGAPTFDDVRRVIGLGAGALQHEAVEGRELVGVEAQRPAAARLHRVQLGPGPVEDRHEIVADDGHAAGGEIAQRLAIILEQRLEVALAKLDRLGHRQAFHHAPAQSKRLVALDQSLAPLDLVSRPNHAIGDLVQRRDDSGRPGLPRIDSLTTSSGPNQRQVCSMSPLPPRTSASE